MNDPNPRDRTFRASDGYEFQVAEWAARGTPRGFVVVLHGVQSHSGWYHNLGSTLAGAGFEVSFPNRRGSGPNRKDRGHAPSGVRLVGDVTEWVDSLKQRDRTLPVTLAGISWGGKLALLSAVRRPDAIDLLALICPGLEPQVGVTLGEKLRIAKALFTDRRKPFPIPLADPALFTDDPDRQKYIREDPLALREATAGLMVASFMIDRRIRLARRRLKQPTLLMLGGRDRIIDNERTRAYFEGIAASDRTLVEYPDGCHTLEFDPDPRRYAVDLIRWIDARITTVIDGRRAP